MMLDWLLQFTRDFALAVWLGGLVVIDFVEAPAKFRVAEINRNQAVAVGRAVFAALNRMEVIAGALLLAASALLVRRADVVTFNAQTAVGAAGLMWLIALGQYLWVRPRVTALAQGLDLVNRNPGNARYNVLKRWHKAYVALDLLKIILGITTLALWL